MARRWRSKQKNKTKNIKLNKFSRPHPKPGKSALGTRLARWSGGKRESGPLQPCKICILAGVPAFKPLDWTLTNFSSRFPHKFRDSLTLILNEMLSWNEKEIKIWRFSRPKPILFRFSQITLGTKTNYVIIGPVWPGTKPWGIIYQQFASYVSRSRKMIPFATYVS